MARLPSIFQAVTLLKHQASEHMIDCAIRSLHCVFNIASLLWQLLRPRLLGCPTAVPIPCRRSYLLRQTLLA